MFEKLLWRSLAAVAAVTLLMGTAPAVTIETVPVANLENTGEWSGQSYGGWGPDRLCGAVGYNYRIGTYEVTAGQYRDFLNDVDPNGTNTDGLYNSSMDSLSYGCQITWNSGSSTYDFSGRPSGAEADWEDRPVNYVSWYDAAMFANWLTSGNIHQGAYDTTTGDPVYWGDSDGSKYTGITPHDSAAMGALVATYGEVWVIPTEDEWYKAAYHKNDGDTGNYFDYPTSSNSAPGYVDNDGELSGTSIPFVDGVTDPGNYATYDADQAMDAIGPDYYRTEVGEWENSDSPYGTFDQGGNITEWTEALIGSDRVFRGSAFPSGGVSLHAAWRSDAFPTHEYETIGFRVASIPEPGSITLLVYGALGLFAYGWRRRRR